MDLENIYYKYVGSLINFEKIKEIISETLIFSNIIIEMLDKSENITLSINEDVISLEKDDIKYDSLIPFSFYGKKMYASKFILHRVLHEKADIFLEYVDYTYTSEYGMKLMSVIQVLKICNVKKRQSGR